MDPVDILTMASQAAQLIRSGKDPEKILRGAYRSLRIPDPDDADDSLVLRIARLTEAAGEKRDRLMQYLSQHSGPLPFNRVSVSWGGAVEPGMAEDEPDEEAVKLAEYAEDKEDSARDMMGDFPAFSVARRQVSGYFGGRTIITRKGKKLTEEQAGELRPGDSVSTRKEGLPKTVRGLIDYPLEHPCLFTIDVGEEPWSLWDICLAFADQYARIYEQPEKYGIWGHDMTDLWIERLLYFPRKRLIYPHVGS
jgi:hypothetical protein